MNRPPGKGGWRVFSPEHSIVSTIRSRSGVGVSLVTQFIPGGWMNGTERDDVIPDLISGSRYSQLSRLRPVDPKFLVNRRTLVHPPSHSSKPWMNFPHTRCNTTKKYPRSHRKKPAIITCRIVCTASYVLHVTRSLQAGDTLVSFLFARQLSGTVTLTPRQPPASKLVESWRPNRLTLCTSLSFSILSSGNSSSFFFTVTRLETNGSTSGRQFYECAACFLFYTGGFVGIGIRLKFYIVTRCGMIGNVFSLCSEWRAVRGGVNAV